GVTPHTYSQGGEGRKCCRVVVASAQRRERWLREEYGLTALDYPDMVVQEGGVCAICGHRPKWWLDVDHDHAIWELGKKRSVRGLLCARCNLGIGHFRDDPDRLRTAATYLGGVVTIYGYLW